MSGRHDPFEDQSGPIANQETGYTVARVATGRSSDLLTVVGPLLGAQPGESLRLQGRWTSHPQYGRQFRGVAGQFACTAWDEVAKSASLRPDARR